MRVWTDSILYIHVLNVIKYWTGLFRSVKSIINPWSQEQETHRWRLRRVRSDLEDRARAERNRQNGLDDDEDSRPRQFETESDIINVVETAIEKAMQAGSFDNLRNKGRPLPSQPKSVLQYAMRIMRDNGIRPPWLQLMLDIDRDIKSLRQMLSNACSMYLPSKTSHWNYAVRSAQMRIKDINAAVDTFNISRPMSMQHLFRLRLHLDDEIHRAMLKVGVDAKTSCRSGNSLTNKSSVTLSDTTSKV